MDNLSSIVSFISLPQPNLQAFATHLHDAASAIREMGDQIKEAAAQAAPMPDMPLEGAIREVSIRFQAKVQGLQEALLKYRADIQGEIRQTQAGLEELRAEFRTEQGLLGMRLYNSVVHQGGKLRYPSGIDEDQLVELPDTIGQLESFTARRCENARAALGLPKFHQRALVGEKRKIIADYLGVYIP